MIDQSIHSYLGKVFDLKTTKLLSATKQKSKVTVYRNNNLICIQITLYGF